MLYRTLVPALAITTSTARFTATSPVGSRTHFARQASTASIMLLFGICANALPAGGLVVAGNASVASGVNNMTITQSSQSAAINWQSFNVAAGEAIRFVQPNSNAVALNRVLGANPSSILGSLTANGKVFLINPSGILFGKGAQVNVGGLIASSLNLLDSDLMAGSYQLLGDGGGEVLNQGQINAAGGYVALLGAHVGNDGSITAQLGTVALAAGKAITLNVIGDGLLNVTVSQGTANALLRNGGLIQADGGQVLLTAQAAGNLLQSAVNNTGVIQAQTLENHSGIIKLLGGTQNGTVNVDGTLNAAAPNGGNGGFIETSAAKVSVANSARIETLALRGKSGTWLIDPRDFTIADAGGDIATATLVGNLLASNITISSNDGLAGTTGDIHVNSAVHWAGATTLTLNAVHDVLINAPVTMDTAGAKLALVAGHDVATTQPITAVAAGSAIMINAANDIRIGAALNAIAAGSNIQISAANDLNMGGAITATAANSVVDLRAGRDALTSAAIIAVAADSLIKISAGRDVITSTTAAIAASAATTQIELNAGRNINVNSAIAAGAAGSGIRLIAGLASTGPGASGGTVKLLAAVASPNISIRFNPDGYANTSSEIANYPALADAKAWLFTQANTKVYDGTSAATLSLLGQPTEGGVVTLNPGTAVFANKSVGTNKVITFRDYQLGGADANKFALIAGAGTTTADITARVLSVVATGTQRTYDGTTTDQVSLTDNRIAGDVLNLSYSGANFIDKNVGIGKAVTVTGIQASGSDANNYKVQPTAASVANITPAELTITASNAEKSFGQTPTLSAFTSVGLVTGETIGSVTETSLGVQANAGVANGPFIIVPSQPMGGTFTASNYSINYRNGSLKVNTVPMVVTAANDSKLFGTTDELTAFSVTGLVNGDTIGAFKIFSPGSAASATVAGSPYPIKLSEASGGSFVASNYSIVYVDGILTVLPLLQTSAGRLAPLESIPAFSAAAQGIALTVELAESPPGLLTIVASEESQEALVMRPQPMVVPTGPTQ